ncbi:MAG TPA: 6-carboxyhexanoate--CoA ligase, partial [Nitrospirota bacterium]
MTRHNLYSIRMRATLAGKHISGSERIAFYPVLDAVAQELIARAKGKSCPPDQIMITIESLGDKPPRTLTALDVVTLDVPDMERGREAAAQALQAAGVSAAAAEA